ncbi:MAG: hypothetical protein GDA44_15195 [Prochloron sp. SP5CPC1]|nr:hypothetical protein [Candidatus Paraprochloron terpiosi SP5CPC1]
MSDPTDDRGKVAEPALPELKNQEQFYAETTRGLAIFLLIILAGSFFAVLAVLTWFIDYQETERLKMVEELFKFWLPVISGLTGSAVTYYFTKKGK